MSNTPSTVSRDPKDYSPKIRAWINASAKVFFNGDVQRAWDEFFKSMEDDDETVESSPETNTAVIHLKARQ